MNRLDICVLSISCLLATTGLAFGEAAKQRIRGDVVALKGPDLEVEAGEGQVVTARLADKVRVSARSGADVGAITSGAFVGTTAIPQPDGTLSAVEVHVFPESMRGTREGHRPMGTERGSTMTNATVTSVAAAEKTTARSTMTNATVTNVAANGPERRITLKHKDGEKVVIVNAFVPVVMVEPGDASMQEPGVHIIVTASVQLDGTLTADRISVGKNGLDDARASLFDCMEVFYNRQRRHSSINYAAPPRFEAMQSPGKASAVRG